LPPGTRLLPCSSKRIAESRTAALGACTAVRPHVLLALESTALVRRASSDGSKTRDARCEPPCRQAGPDALAAERSPRSFSASVAPLATYKSLDEIADGWVGRKNHEKALVIVTGVAG